MQLMKKSSAALPVPLLQRMRRWGRLCWVLVSKVRHRVALWALS